MKLMLRELFETESLTRQFECEVQMDDRHLPAGFSLSKPISLKGEATNRAGVVVIDYRVKAPFDLVCDRCLTEFERVFEYDFSHTIVRSLNSDKDSDEYIVCENDTLDLNDLAISDLLLTLPTKILCRDDCKGLCPVCGGNLNDGSCECSDR